MPAPTAETLAATLEPLTRDPSASALFFDVDGTLAPIVERAEDARVPEDTSRLLGALAGRYALVACVSGRSASEARRLVGVEGIAYAGAHGAELIERGGASATVMPALAEWSDRIKAFAAERGECDLRPLGVRLEDKGAIAAFHWRGAPDEDAARDAIEAVARDAEAEGYATHWGRKVLEVRPPVPFHKGQAVSALVRETGARGALYAGDDATDLDAFGALDSLEAAGEIDHAARLGVASAEGPAAIAERADLLVDGTDGVLAVLHALADA